MMHPDPLTVLFCAGIVLLLAAIVCACQLVAWLIEFYVDEKPRDMSPDELANAGDSFLLTFKNPVHSPKD